MRLGYPLPNKVQIDGKDYELNLSFDNVLRLFDMLNDERLSDHLQVITGLRMLIGTNLPEYSPKEQEEIFYQIFQEFIGKEAEKSIATDIAGNPLPQQNNKEKDYDLEQDAPYIYASFMSDYKMDLFEQQGKLHWYKFKALLSGLTEGSKFIRVIDIRTMDLPKGKGSEAEKQRKRIKELKEYYKLKDDVE